MLSCVSTRLKSLLILRSRNAIRNITTTEEESQFSDEELEKFKQLFVKFDFDRNCKLDRWEFNKFAGRLIGRSYYSTDLYKVFCKVDKNRDEFVSWPELHDHLHRRFSEQSRNKMVAAFNLFDKDNDGLLHWWETKQAIFYLGENITDKNMRYNFDLFDHDQDERLSFPQFLKFICEHLKRQR